MTRPGRELGARKARARASRGPAPSPDAALLVHGDWRVRPRDEWGDRGGGTGRGRGGRPGRGWGESCKGRRAEAAPPCSAAGQRSPHPASRGRGSGGRALVPGRGGLVGPGSDRGSRGLRCRLGKVGVEREKLLFPPGHRHRASPPPENPFWVLRAYCAEGLALRRESCDWNPRLDLPVWTRSFFPFLHQYPFF